MEMLTLAEHDMLLTMLLDGARKASRLAQFLNKNFVPSAESNEVYRRVSDTTMECFDAEQFARDIPYSLWICQACMQDDCEDCSDGNRVSCVPYECACAINRHGSEN